MVIVMWFDTRASTVPNCVLHLYFVLLTHLTPPVSEDTLGPLEIDLRAVAHLERERKGGGGRPVVGLATPRP